MVYFGDYLRRYVKKFSRENFQDTDGQKATRDILMRSWGTEKLTPRDKVSASGIAGGVSGGFGGMLCKFL